MTKRQNLSITSNNTQSEVEPSSIRSNVLVTIAEQWAIDECIKRNILHSTMNGYGIQIGKESINDASMLLMHHYINYKSYEVSESTGYGLVEWLRIEAYEAAINGELVDINKEVNLLKVKYRSTYWTFGGFNQTGRDLYQEKRKEFAGHLTLLGIKVSKEEPVNFMHNHRETGIFVSVHVLNRLTTRALKVFIEKGLMVGQNICEFIITALKKAKFEKHLGDHTFQLSYYDMKFVAIETDSNRKLITVLS